MATSEIDLLAATLLLCLSNLLYMPAIGVAIYRGFYPESFVYFANMVFSTVRNSTSSYFNRSYLYVNCLSAISSEAKRH